MSEPGALATPGGGYGFRFFDNEGRTVEVSSDVAVRAHRKIEEGESIPVRLSHVVVNSATPEATVAWYERHLGFALSDTLMHPHMGEMMYFLRINRWHHSLAIARCPHPSLHHASFELRGIDEYMRGTGRLLQRGRGEDLGTRTAPGRQQHLQLLPRPAREHRRVHHRARAGSTRTPGTRTCTTSPSPGSPTSGAPRTR